METISTLFLTTVFVFVVQQLLLWGLNTIKEKRNYKTGKWKKGYKRK